MEFYWFIDSIIINKSQNGLADMLKSFADLSDSENLKNVVGDIEKNMKEVMKTNLV